MDADLNVENLLETRAERAPRTDPAWGQSRRREQKHSLAAGVAIAAAFAALAILIFSGRSGRQVHVLERY
jgi:hypothetical protein